jgi:uncharacterized repeat protein (TIGR01451 family)
MRGMNRILQIAPVVLALLSFPRAGSAVEFGVAKNYTVGMNAKAIVVADFNNDGKLDIAVANSNSNNVSILLGNGDGTFQATRNFDAGGTGGSSLAVADFNGDGKLDVAVGIPANVQLPGCGGSSVSILYGNGDGTFQPPRQAVAVNSRDIVVATGDLNNDNKADLVVIRFSFDSSLCGGGGSSVFLGNGDGTFQAEKVLSNPPDFNGDGIPDLADANDFTGRMKIWLGKGNGSYERLASGSTSPTGGYMFADLNADQKQDRVSIQARATFSRVTSWVATLIGNGDGTFQPAQIYPPGGYACDHGACVGINEIGVADFNGDGKLDVAVINAGMQGFRIFLGKGDGTLSGPFDFDTGSGPLTFAIADLNGDHRPDLILSNINDGAISVVLNTTPASGADLSVWLSATPEPVSVTQNLTYTLQAINAGPQDATNFVLKGTLPAGVNYVSATSNQGSCAQANLVVTCSASKVVSGGDMVTTLVVVPTAAGSANVSANASASETDPSLGNNSASHSTRVDPMFSLKVTKSGAGSGTVVGAAWNRANQINCGSNCNAALPTATPVNLQITPDAGSVFGGWGGACGAGIAPGCALTMNADQSVTATFDKGPNFFLSADATTLTLKRGSSVTTNISILPEGNSFDSTIALSCSFAGPAPTPTCTFAPPSLTPGANSANSMLTITASAQAAALIPLQPGNSMGALYAAWLPLPAVALIGFGLASRSKSRRAWQQLWLSCGLVLGLCALQAGCGSGSNTPLSPPLRQDFTITVTATSGTILKTAQISLTVQ